MHKHIKTISTTALTQLRILYYNKNDLTNPSNSETVNISEIYKLIFYTFIVFLGKTEDFLVTINVV